MKYLGKCGDIEFSLIIGQYYLIYCDMEFFGNKNKIRMVVLLRYIGGGTDDISIVKMYENSYGELLEGENDFRSFAALNTYHMVKSEFLLEDEIFSLSDYDMNHIMVELI